MIDTWSTPWSLVRISLQQSPLHGFNGLVEVIRNFVLAGEYHDETEIIIFFVIVMLT